MYKRIDHIVIAVKNLEQSAALYGEKFGLKATDVGKLTEGLKETTFTTGNTRIVLSQPVDPNGPVARFIEERGEGLYLVALEVDNVDKAAEALRKRGARIAEAPSAEHGRRVFIHPKSAHGVLFQLVESKA
ncbi:MAG: VOC family protein [Dehalococcoidia bacterium]|nr:VOC family protein [Dehalococcoidia bacterium]